MPENPPQMLLRPLMDDLGRYNKENMSDNFNSTNRFLTSHRAFEGLEEIKISSDDQGHFQRSYEAQMQKEKTPT